MKKQVKLILGLVLIVLTGISVYFLIINFFLSMEITGLGSKKEREFSQKAAQERELVRKEFEQKYQGDLLSFEAKYRQLDKVKMKSRNLEIKSQELQESLEKKDKKTK